jgi:competence protein ComEA
MEPLDPLDQLLRGRAADPWWDRVRVAATGRLPWIVASVVIAGIVVAVLMLRSPAPGAAVSFPRAGSTPAGGTVAATGGPVVPSPGSAASSSIPASSPTTSAASGLVVHVAGAVVTPGLVTLPAGARVADAVAAAGGLRGDADGDRINLAAPLSDGVRVFVPTVGQPDPAPAVGISGGATGSSGGTGSGPASSVPAAPIDINTATAEELDALPGVGPSTAAAIVAYRQEHRRFASVDELQEVKGIGPAKFEALEPMVTVGR